MKLNIFLWFGIGFGIGYVSKRLTSFDSAQIESIIASQEVDTFDVKTLNTFVPSIENVKKIQILCILNTKPADHSMRAIHIMKTWGKHCDKLLFMSMLTDVNLDAIGFNVTNNDVWEKVQLMMTHIHKNYLNEYDWFIKGEDKTFLITENLRYMLSAYSTKDPIYFGYKFNTTEHKRGYFSDGSGYVMSRQTVRIFVEKVLTNKEFLTGHDRYYGCHLGSGKRFEDWDMTVCLEHYNVYAGDARDLLKRERFLLFWPEAHLFGRPDFTNWTDEGLDCCSNFTISFHYILAKYQYSMYFLTYRLQPFGIERRFPPPPMKKDFHEVTKLLSRERIDPSLRGY